MSDTARQGMRRAWVSGMFETSALRSGFTGKRVGGRAIQSEGKLSGSSQVPSQTARTLVFEQPGTNESPPSSDQGGALSLSNCDSLRPLDSLASRQRFSIFARKNADGRDRIFALRVATYEN